MLGIPTALLTVGLANALGVVVSLVVFTTTSGGHFSPAVTLVHVLFNRFPIAKGARSAKASLINKGCQLTHDPEDTSSLRFSVPSPPVCLCIGNGRHSSRSVVVMSVGWFAHQFPQDAEAVLIAAGQYDAVNFSSSGPAGIFALYSNPKDPIGLVFLNEFVSVWSHLEKLNFEPSTRAPNLAPNRVSSLALLFLRAWTRRTSLRLSALFHGSSV